MAPPPDGPPPPAVLRRLRPEDLPLADELRSLAGWNQTPADWRRLLRLEPEGCFAAEIEGRVVGTATTTCFELELAWIGMVLVHPDFRGRGTGRALLLRSLDHLQERGVERIGLDASPAGKPLYERQGFRSAWSLTRWECAAPDPRALVGEGRARPLRPGDWEALLELDGRAFGAPRERLLRELAGQSVLALVVESGDPGPAAGLSGYGFVRAGARARYLGPLAALSAPSARSLVASLLGAAPREPVFWDIPDPNLSAREAAEELGFKRQRPLTRMFLGREGDPGSPRLQFALADPATG